MIVSCVVVEKIPDPKSGQEVDPDKPRCTIPCQGDETHPYFLHAFFWMFSPIPDPRDRESVVGSAPVDHPIINHPFNDISNGSILTCKTIILSSHSDFELGY